MSEPDGSDRAGTGSAMRVLVIDDDAAMLAALAAGLGSEGFQVETAPDGIEGLWMATESDFDILVVDLMLPGISGFEVCRRVRQNGSTVPILMLTAKDGEHDEAQALDLGADDYLSKPFSFLVLGARIRALLRRSPADRSPNLTIGDLTIDPAARKCWRGGDEISLTAREFSLLEFLMHRRGIVSSRATIARHVWDAELDIDSNIVDVYVGYLRRKIDRPFGRHDIQTVRGVGYSLDAAEYPSARSGSR
jgi:two-component system OmpR family response regulator